MSRNNANENFVQISTSDIPRYIQLAWKTYRETGLKPVVYLVGPPGSGKTAQVSEAARLVAESENLNLSYGPTPGAGEFGFTVTQFANSSEEVIAGLPFVSDKNANTPEQRRAIVRSFPRGGPGIWFCDEPLQASYTQRFLAQLTHGGKIDDYYELPEDVLIVMAGNSARDRAGVSKPWTHFQNRIMTIEVTPDVEGALANFDQPATPEVACYLRWFPDKLYRFDPRQDGPFPTARTWDFTNSLITAGADPVQDFPAFQGYLGHRDAADFRACYQSMESLDKVKKVFDDPEANRSWIKQCKATVMCAMQFMVLRQLLVNRDMDLAAKAIRVFEIYGLEHSAAYIAAARDIDSRSDDGKQIVDTPEYVSYVARNGDFVAN